MTIAERINGERLVVLGWGRAILLQIAHPLVAAGVAGHSRFTAHRFARLGRLHSTIRAMRRLTFGDEQTVCATAAAINAIHARVHGSLAEEAGPFPAGTRYTATDPALLRWVHATLLDSLPLAYEQFVGSLTDAEKDAFCAQSAPAARLLHLPEDHLLATRAALDRYLQEMLASQVIAVTPVARQLASELLYPPLTDATGPGAWLVRLVTLGLLPAAVRHAYGFPWTPRHDRRLRLVSAVLRKGRPLLPALVARWGR